MIPYYFLALALATAGVLVARHGSEKATTVYSLILFFGGLALLVFYFYGVNEPFDTNDILILLFLFLPYIYFACTIVPVIKYGKLRRENKKLTETLDNYGRDVKSKLEHAISEKNSQIIDLKMQQDKEVEKQVAVLKAKADRENKELLESYVSQIAELKKKHEKEVRQLTAEIKSLRESSAPADETLANEHRVLTQKLLESRNKCKALEDKCKELKDKCEDYQELVDTYKQEMIEMDHRDIHKLRMETWGPLLQRRNNGRFKLTAKDFLAIHYPPFDPENVYYAPLAGRLYHSVPWCYTLDTANGITCDSIRNISKDYKACPYCVCPPSFGDQR